MTNNTEVSQPVSKAESTENKRSTPRIFLAVLGVGAVAIVAVFTIGTEFVFH